MSAATIKAAMDANGMDGGGDGKISAAEMTVVLNGVIDGVLAEGGGGGGGSEYVSPWTTLLASSETDHAHGLGLHPSSVEIEVKCITAEHGYSVGDILKLTGLHYLSVLKDDTNVRVIVKSGSGQIYIQHYTTYAQSTITNTKWQYRVRAVGSTPVLEATGNEFIGGWNALVAAAVEVHPHGLGVHPSSVYIEIKNITATQGYAVGDILKVDGFSSISSKIDDTNITTSIKSGGANIYIQDGATGAQVTIVLSKWQYRVRATGVVNLQGPLVSLEPDIVIEFEGGTNVGGGAITAYFDDPRIFNTIVEDKFGTISLITGGAHIAGVPIGTYRVRHWGSFHSAGVCKNAIYNLTAGTPDLCMGNPTDTTDGGTSYGEGTLVCTAISTIFQHYFRTSSPAGTEALGQPMVAKPKNIHARIELWKMG